MSETLANQLRADGWTVMDDDGFINLIGPLWHRPMGETFEYAIVGQDKHRNRRGVVQGGVLMTMADRTCGMTARHVSKAESLATVQFDTHFIDATQIGDVMISRPRAVRVTKSLIYMATDIHVGERCVTTSVGVFKIVRKPA
jgi:acyl-coenzyme A thioesterase PaaI-like protein